MAPTPFSAAITPYLSATVAATVAAMRSYQPTTPVDIDMAMGELKESMDRMDIDTTTTTSSEDLDLLAMDLDVAFQGLGTTSPVPPPPPPSPSTSPTPPPPSRRAKSVVKYYYDYEAFTAEGTPDFGLLRRNIRHIDSVVRSLASEPYATRRLAVRDLYRPFTHMTRTLDSFKHRGRGGLNENHVEVGKYIHHMRNLKSIVTAFGSANDETRLFKNAVDKLDRTRLPEQKIIKLKVAKTGSTTSSSTASSSGSEGSQRGATVDPMDVDDNIKVTRLSQRLRRFRMDMDF